MRFYYEAIDHDGNPVAGDIDAGSLQEAEERLRGWFASIETVREPIRWAALFRRSLSAKSLALLFRQLALMLSAGVPIHRSLAMCMHGEEPGLDTYLWQMADRVNSGWSISEAMAEHPSAFPDIAVAIVRVGEETGRLPSCLNRLSDIMMRAFEMRQKMLAGLTYPISVAVLGLTIFAIMAVFALPRMEEIFSTLGVQLPIMTRVVLSGFKILLNPFTLLALVLGGLVGLLTLRASVAGRRRLFQALEDRLSQTRLFGPLLEDWRTSMVLHHLAAVLDSGVPLLEGMNLLSRAAPSPLVRARIDLASADLQEGGTLTEAFERHEVIAKTGLLLMSAGETAGRVVPMLSQGAAYHELQLAHRVEVANSLLGPAMLLVVGVAVGVLAVAMMLPFFDVISAL